MTKSRLIERQPMLHDDLARRLAEEFADCAATAGLLMTIFEEAERRYLIRAGESKMTRAASVALQLCPGQQSRLLGKSN